MTDKRFHSNLAIAPTCDTASTYHITDNTVNPQRPERDSGECGQWSRERDPQRGLSRATYLLKVSRRAALPNEEES